MLHKLDIHTLPLHGRRLIEASAGTGKTYTIVNLYLRLLLNVGQAGNYGRPLNVDEILVVTFTEAATQELKDRIRKRIGLAREALLVGHSTDPFLAQLINMVTEPAVAIQQLLVAERNIDNASVFTIHGFCQRMLKQFAFESGSLFENTMEPNLEPLRLIACQDYWRAQFYPLDALMVYEINQIWETPAQMLADIRGYLDKPLLRITAAGGEHGSITDYVNQRLSHIAQVKTSWCAQRQELTKAIEGNISRYTGKNYQLWLDGIDQWAMHDVHTLALPKNLPKFAQETLREKTKKGKATPSLYVFEQIQQLVDAPFDLRSQLIKRAIPEVRSHFEQLKNEQHLIGFDDLLIRLDRSLAGAQALQLKQAIGEQYPVALIDEFQDTDPLQYRIFDQIYGDQSALGWLIIGDPKQAIYAFRGADIFTYMQAKSDTPDHYRLDKNYRSAKALVDSVNRLFSAHAAPFIYQQQIDFDPVSANDRSESLSINQAPLPAMQICLAEGETLNRDAYRNQMADACVAHIQHLLEASNQQQLTIGNEPLKPSDIAILVRTGREAELMKQRLNSQGIASVYLSGRNSVFASQEATDLRFILAAMLKPDSERCLMAALASQLFALPLEALNHTRNDEQQWQLLHEEFSHYQQVWLQHGVLAALRAMVWQRGLASQLLEQDEGERRLTNLFQLAELLQQASVDVEGQTSLVRWFERQCDTPDGNQEQQQLRLESEQPLLQIVTIHKSKGLEYPLVCVPFLCEYRESWQPVYHKEGETVLDLNAQEAALEKAEQERLAEDLRLLYVALTRAVYQLWLGIGPLRCNRKRSGQSLSLQRTAIGYLLGMQDDDGHAELTEKLQQLASIPSITLDTPQALPAHRYVAPEDTSPSVTARTFTGTLDHQWQLSSYTALTKYTSHWDPLMLPKLDEMTQASDTQTTSSEVFDRFHFPKGAAPGIFLHQLFETLEFTQPDSWDETVKELLEQSHFDNDWLPCLQEWVADALNLSLTDGISLNQISADNKLVEMEFYLPVGQLTAESINGYLQQYRAQFPHTVEAHPLGFEQFHGMLKGFIDLVFCHNEKFYLLDYKSNHLGNEAQCYQPEQLYHAMIEHNYDLQYLIYSVTLHRYLKKRVPNYHYDTHFGGVFYLYLRGVSSDADANTGVYAHRPTQEAIEQLDSLLGGDDEA